MALDVELALSRSSVLLVNSLARSKSECLNFNALGALVAQPNRLQNRLFLANVTKPGGRGCCCCAMFLMLPTRRLTCQHIIFSQG